MGMTREQAIGYLQEMLVVKQVEADMDASVAIEHVKALEMTIEALNTMQDCCPACGTKLTGGDMSE